MSDRPEKSPRKQQKRSLRTKQKLLDAALDAFSESGFAGTSTRDIAARAGVHHPLITYHFSNKDRLWRSAVKYIFADFIDALKATQAENVNACPKARFASMIRIYIYYAASKPALHKIIFQESSNPSSRLDWLSEKFLKPLSEASSGYIAELQDKGVVRPGNPQIIYNMIRVSSGGLIALALELKSTSNIDFSSDETLEELTELIIQTFLPGETKSAAA
ncbi:MAG: TetR/AcrR family transcriptional regulator [Woeseia sp.]|nr:TetR/AcrR family transcriptional regulator [Woeseia sp.]